MDIRDTSWRDDPSLRYKLPEGVIALQAEVSALRDEVVRIDEELSAARRAKIDEMHKGLTVEADAELGNLVRQMPARMAIQRTSQDWLIWPDIVMSPKQIFAKDLGAALREAVREASDI